MPADYRRGTQPASEAGGAAATPARRQPSRRRLARRPADPSPWLDLGGVKARRSFALCRGAGADLFFPAGEVCPEGAAHADAAKSVCRVCPVRVACLEFALAADQEYGVWGGLTEVERKRLRSPRPSQPAPAPVPQPASAVPQDSTARPA